jgi:hypothetical protein
LVHADVFGEANANKFIDFFFEKYAEACRRESPAHIIIIIIIIIGSKTTASMHSKWQNVQSTSFMV